jgi:hypothetical protein
MYGSHSGDNEDLYFLGWNAVPSVEIFSFGQFHATLLLRLIFMSEDGDNMFLRNID